MVPKVLSRGAIRVVFQALETLYSHWMVDCQRCSVSSTFFGALKATGLNIKMFIISPMKYCSSWKNSNNAYECNVVPLAVLATKLRLSVPWTKLDLTYTPLCLREFKVSRGNNNDRFFRVCILFEI